MRMSPPRVALALAALALSAVAPQASSGEGMGPGFRSPNVAWVANIPLDTPGIGGRVVQVGAQRRFYVTGAKGLTIYDVTSPALPMVLGALPLPHFENESVAVSDDGSTVIVASDEKLANPPLTYIVDTSVVTAPRLAGVIPESTHTATCATADCRYVYGNRGWIYDIADPLFPRKVTGPGIVAAHYLNRDAAGLVSDGYSLWDPRTDPENPVRIDVQTGGWHNSLRPNADGWTPRSAGDNSAPLRPGELHIGSDETWLSPGLCNQNSGAITTWSIRNFDQGAKATLVSTIRPRNGDYGDGSPPADVVGCSSHWFDYRDGVLAAGWYDHGIRFVEIDEQTGAATEAGYFVAANAETWAAFWIDDEYVYAVDAARGIDIVRYYRDGPAPSAADLDASWTGSPARRPLSEATRREVYLCRLEAGRGT